VPEKLRIGILRETKIPPDRRVALPPAAVSELVSRNPGIDVIVQPSEIRCYKDEEYLREGVILNDDLSSCDILVGVKEVDVKALIPGKSFMFFAHVAKEQPYNRNMLRAILKQKIRLIDYEYLTDHTGIRLIAFGRWAGIVGAYNALRGWGIRTGRYELKPAHECHDHQGMNAQLDHVNLKNARILISGGGRVAQGAMETLKKLGIREASPGEYLSLDYDEPVYCRIDPWHYVERINGSEFSLNHFFENPGMYRSVFKPYAEKTDIYIASHYWDPDSPRMFSIDELKKPSFRIKMIADISCDINGSVPSTLRATTIPDPFYGFDPKTGKEINPFSPLPPVTMMTVDNLPGELPRDASSDFARVLVEKIIPKLTGNDPEGVIERATIAEDGKLTENFLYLKAYVEGR